MKAGSVLLLLVPGLDRELLWTGALPRLRAELAEWRVSGLVPSFPCLPASVEASALRGQYPARHRVRLSTDAPSPAHPSVGEQLDARHPGSFIDARSAPLSALEPPRDAGLTLVRHDGLLTASLEHGLDSWERIHAAADLDAEFAVLRARLPEHTICLVLGSPGLRPAGELVRLPSSLMDREPEIESAVLRLRGLQESDAAEVRNELLRCRGVERVLWGEGLAAWGAAADAPCGELYALSRLGWSFEKGAVSMGHPEVPERHGGVLIARIRSDGPAWPPELHDHRLAPSLARYFDLPEEEYRDRPFSL